MEAISFGLIAAIAWGVHDILVRHVSQKQGILVSLTAVLVLGVLIQSPLVLLFGDLSNLPAAAVWNSLAAGVTFSAASIGLYIAFNRGPVRLVAPLIGSYSVLAFVLAAAQGAEVSLSQWFALVLLVVGIAFVARSSDVANSEKHDGLIQTIAWCVLAMVGFSLTFELGQTASTIGDPMATGLVTRAMASVVIVVLLVVTIVSSANEFKIPDRKTVLIFSLMAMLDTSALAIVLAAGIFPRPEFASAASSIFGLVTVVLAWIFMSEKINLTQWLGIIFVFLAIGYLGLS